MQRIRKSPAPLPPWASTEGLCLDARDLSRYLTPMAPDDSKARKGYHHGNLKRALVEATLELVVEKGPLGFTIAEAARKAGVSASAPYRHFKGRDNLLEEAAREGFEIFADLMEHAYTKAQPSPLASFEATGRAYLAFARRFPGHYICMFESGLPIAANAGPAAGDHGQPSHMGNVPRRGGTIRTWPAGREIALPCRRSAGNRGRHLPARSRPDRRRHLTARDTIRQCG